MFINGLGREAQNFYIKCDKKNYTIGWDNLKEEFRKKFERSDGTILRWISSMEQKVGEDPIKFLNKVVDACDPETRERSAGEEK